MFNAKLTAALALVGLSVVAISFTLPAKSVAPQFHQIEIVSVVKLEPFGPGSTLNDFCGVCTMVTDSQLNSYFMSGFSYGQASTFINKPASLVKTGQLQLCTPDQLDCMTIDSVNNHGLSDLPAAFFSI